MEKLSFEYFISKYGWCKFPENHKKMPVVRFNLSILVLAPESELMFHANHRDIKQPEVAAADMCKNKFSIIICSLEVSN